MPRVEDKFVKLRGLTFHYRDWSGRGAPIILLHGLASQSHIFDLVAPLLAENFRVIALDQRGHGESSKPDDGFDFDNIVADLLAFLDALKIGRAIIAGHSWGGNVALQFAAEHPDRTNALVLIDGGFLDLQSNPEMTWEQTEKRLAPPKLGGTPVEEFKARIRQFAGKMWKPEIERIVLHNFEILADQTIRPRLAFENHMRILRALWEQRPQQLYPKIKCPVLLVPALLPRKEDREFVKAKRKNVVIAHRALVESKIVWFKDTLHDVPLHRPRKLANVIKRFVMEVNR